MSKPHQSSTIIVMFGILFLAACQRAPTGTAESAPTIELTRLVVDKNLTAGVPYEVSMPYEASADGSIDIDKACFMWSGEGPYCFRADHDRSGKTISAMLSTGNPSVYRLAGFVRYRSNGWDMESNAVSSLISVE